MVTHKWANIKNDVGLGVEVHEFELKIIFESDDKILDSAKLNAFADGKINAAQKDVSVSDGIVNLEGKGENAGYQQFLLFPQCFQRLLHQDSLDRGLHDKGISADRMKLPFNHNTHYETLLFGRISGKDSVYGIRTIFLKTIMISDNI